MGTLSLPNVRQLLCNQNGNQVWQHYSQGGVLEDVQLLHREPFVVTSSGINYLLTSNENLDIFNQYEYILLVTKSQRATIWKQEL